MPPKNHVGRYKLQGSNIPVEINDDAGTLTLGGVYGWRPDRDSLAPKLTRRCYVYLKDRRFGLSVTFTRNVRDILIRKIVAGALDEHPLLATHVEDAQVVFPSLKKKDVVVNKRT